MGDRKLGGIPLGGGGGAGNAERRTIYKGYARVSCRAAHITQLGKVSAGFKRLSL